MIDCPKCGAPLSVADDGSKSHCPYCGAAISGTRASSGGGKSSRLTWIGAALGVAALLVGAALWFVFIPDSATGGLKATAAKPYSAPPKAETARSVPPRPVVTSKPAPAPRNPPRALPKPRAQPPVAVSADGYVSRNDAKRLLEPGLLSCMRKANVHYLVTSLGQGYDVKPTGPLGPLQSVNPSYIDYRKHSKEDFDVTPLGQCVLAVAADVKTRAIKGAYLTFTLRNPDATDPLAGAPARLDPRSLTERLADRDVAGRDCFAKHPNDAPSGGRVNIGLHFRGIDGSVERLQILYLDAKSPFGQCITDVYMDVRADPFRSLTSRVAHVLSP